ncbi:MAG: glycosyltransferase [Candidatus Saccharimonadales bacterium]|nr:glycosyltransferase [Candidatus Saccharimonadales bacterium]
MELVDCDYAMLKAMVETLDIWFWALALSILFTVQPFVNSGGAQLRFVRWLAVIFAAAALMVSVTFIESLPGTMVATVSSWHLLSVYRFIKRRHNDQELTRRVRTTTLWLMPLMLIGTYVYVYEQNLLSNTSIEYTQVFIVSLSLAIGLLVALTTLWNLLTRRIKRSPVISDQQKPTVTLAIPARNETHALSAAIERAVASDYPKLEILVLDDCSQDKTSDIIKKFAHDGVRFVQGIEPSSSWLGKNRAYRILSEEASGEVIIFSGVDVHFQEASISRLIEYMLNNKLSMVSVMPRRRGVNFWANFLQPLRYLSQIALPLDMFGRQPVLSSCWAVDRQSLKGLRGFTPIKGEIVPEQHFARIFAHQHRYEFVIGDKWLGISTQKKLSSQIETATRTLYPRIRQEMALLLAVVLFSLLVFVLPYLVVMDWLLSDYPADSLVNTSLIAIGLFSLANLSISLKNQPKLSALSLISLPFIVVSYAVTAIWSSIKYEFGTVNWKGRNVCLPVLEQKRAR